MIINATSQAVVAGNMRIGGRNAGSVNSLGLGLTVVNAGSGAKPSSAQANKSSIYDNFSKEMSRRLTESSQIKGYKDDEPDSSVLVQSLTGAMGEIEQIFGREAATEVMATVLTGTDGKMTEESLVSSLQHGLAGLNRVDSNGMKIKQLTKEFNKDLNLLLDQDIADKKIKNGETLSLSYAISQHFGSLVPPDKIEDGSIVKSDINANDDDTIGTSSIAGEEAANTAKISSSQQSSKNMKCLGFDESGRWDVVDVEKMDEASAEEMREAAEAGIGQANELTLATIMEQGKGGNIFDNLANFLHNEMQDKESAAFVEQCITDSYSLMCNKYGSSPKFTDMISQVYSKVAADGDTDKIATLENYLNGDFKEAINQSLAVLQDEGFLGGAEVGELQFKGISGASLAGESDSFSLTLGYKDDGSYNKTVSKRFLQENIREVKAVKEKKDEAAQQTLVDNWSGTDTDEKIVRKASEADGKKSKSLGESLDEKFTAERRENKLEEVMTIKFGQLSDASRENLTKYINDNFNEEDAEKLLEHTKWSNDLMSGLAAIHQDIRESGANESKAAEFMKFINTTMSGEVEKVASELGGISFDGWQAQDGISGELKATFSFGGQGDPTEIIIMGQNGGLAEGGVSQEQPVDVEQILQASQAAGGLSQSAEEIQTDQQYMQRLKETGYLINLVA